MRVVIDDEDERFPKIVWQEYVSGNKYKGDIIWDGKFKDGKRAPQGTYYITIKAADMAGNESRRTGSVTIGRLGFLQSIPAFMPPTSVMDPDANPPTPSASTTSTTFGGTITSSMGAVNQSVLLSTGAASSSTLPPSNILWGVAAAALAGWATSTALEERQRRKEEEEQQRRQAEAQASRLNAAESMRKAQEWQAGQNLLEQQEAGLAAYYSARKLGEAESAQKAELAEQQAGLEAYYEGRKAGEAQQARQTVAAKVLAMPVKEDDPPKWWEKPLAWIDNHQPVMAILTGIGVGLIAVVATIAIIGTAAITLPVVAVVAGATVLTSAILTGTGTIALNNYFDRPPMTNLVQNTLIAAGTGFLISGGALALVMGCATPVGMPFCAAVPPVIDAIEQASLQIQYAYQIATGNPQAGETYIELQFEQNDNGAPGNTAFAELADLFATHGDETVALVNKYGDDAIKLLNTQQLTPAEITYLNNLPGTHPELAQDIINKVGTDYKNNPLRIEYEAKVSALGPELEELLIKNNGVITEADARAFHAMRRNLGIEYKDQTLAPLRDFIYERNIDTYNGDPLGPTWEWMMENYDNNYLDIAKASARFNNDINKTLMKFDTWILEKDAGYLLQSELDMLRGN